MGDRVTMADVARAAGVSTATVSMALTGNGTRISETTAARVRAVAAELGYVPSASARTLRTGRTSSIGFVSDEVTVTRFASGMLRGVLGAAQEREHVVTIMETGGDPDRLAEAFAELRSREVDAVVLGVMDSHLVQLPDVGELPLAVVNATTDPAHPQVLPAEFDAGRAAVDHLLSRGHRAIAAIGLHPTRPEPPVSVNIGVRMDGIAAAMAAAGLELVDRHDGTVWEPELGHAGATAVMRRAPGTTAILAANDRIAFGVYQGLQELGLRIPDDVSVISFDDEPLAEMLRPGLTTLRLPYPEMGRLGVQLALDLAAGLEAPQTSLLPMRLVQRASVRTI